MMTDAYAPIDSPTPPSADVPPMHPVPVMELPADIARKRVTAGLSGVIFGCLGVHKFVMGYTGTAIIMLAISVGTCGVGAIVMWVIGILEGIQYLRLTDAEFNDTYLVGRKSWL